jgi:hypothetical protein
VPNPVSENSHYSPILRSDMFCDWLKFSAAPENKEEQWDMRSVEET